MADKLLKRHVFTFNKNDNGGESLMLITSFFHNGDVDGVYRNQELTLQSYCNSASINLYGTQITSEILFKLAKELFEAEQEAKMMTRNEQQTTKNT